MIACFVHFCIYVLLFDMFTGCPFSQFIETFWGKVKDISEISNAHFTEVKRGNSKPSGEFIEKYYHADTPFAPHVSVHNIII